MCSPESSTITSKMASNDLNFSLLSVEELCTQLRDKVHESALLILEKESITGAMFKNLTKDDLKDLFPQVGARLSVSMVLRELRQTSETTANRIVSTCIYYIVATKYM